MRSEEDCGCAHNGTHWTSLCPPHAKAEATTHAAWLADYRRTVRGASQAPPKPEAQEDWLA